MKFVITFVFCFLAVGTYYENLNFDGKRITVCSWYAIIQDMSYI